MERDRFGMTAATPAPLSEEAVEQAAACYREALQQLQARQVEAAAVAAEKAAAVFAEHLDPGSLDVANARLLLARIHREQGEFVRAEQVQRLVLQTLQTPGRRASPDRVRSLARARRALAETLRMRGCYQEAQEELTRTLQPPGARAAAPD
jgi:hypothetical protein